MTEFASAPAKVAVEGFIKRKDGTVIPFSFEGNTHFSKEALEEALNVPRKEIEDGGNAQ